jgi:predicted Rdx family selenoprotein
MKALPPTLAAVLVAAGCDDAIDCVACPPPPTLESSFAAVRATNVLSVLVTANVRGADSVVVRYGLPSGSLDSLTPAVRRVEGDVEIPVLGLWPETTYELQVVAFGAGDTVAGQLLSATTGSLPMDLPRFSAGGPEPATGYVVFSVGSYGVALDHAGRVVWYVRLPGPSLNFQPQRNDGYIARPGTPDLEAVEPLLELDPLGNVTRRLGCARGLAPRFHDVLVEPDGSYWLMCDETRVMDLSGDGGLPEAEVTGTVVQHLDPAGGVVFEWSSFDHFAITDLDPESRSGQAVNWTHGNSLDLDADGNLLVSFRSLSEITSIDTRTGAVRWRMGGLRNQFTFADPGPPFRGQHGVRVTPDGLVLLDNFGEAEESRAERYAVDQSARTARLAEVYLPTAGTRASLGGTTQELPGHHLLVAFGDGGAVREYDADGSVVWEIEGDPGYVFRAQRIRSLYHPGDGLVR